MVKFGSSRQTNLWNDTIATLKSDRFIKRIVAIAIILFLSIPMLRKPPSINTDSDNDFLVDIPTERCLDQDDSPDMVIVKECKCPDPTKPVADPEFGFMPHHDTIKTLIQQSAKLPTDFAIFGDSITERWTGTANRERGTLNDDSAKVFREFFQTKDLNGVALGSAGDISSHLLYHLQNGWLPVNFNPKVIMIHIGTNDMGRFGCSKRTVLAGILNVINYVQKIKPKAKILIHGLLPRSDTHDEHNLESNWYRILFVNRELKRFAGLHGWGYTDSGSIFLVKSKESGFVSINKELMPDGLHPNDAGYRAWAPLIQKKALEMLKQK